MDAQKGIELHIRISSKNQDMLKDFIPGKKVNVTGPFGHTHFFEECCATIFIAEGIGLAAFNQIMCSAKSPTLPILLVWSARENDENYLSFFNEQWLLQNHCLSIESVVQDNKMIVDKLLNFTHPLKRVRCYFAGSPDLKNHIMTHYVNVINTFADKVIFYDNL
jgi:NAD(P)H-flavin reductase